MCFSASASFVAGAALLPAGAYCTLQAVRHVPRLLPVAVIPVMFGAQQFAEGFVWLAVNREDPAAAVIPALVYLFFALSFWPTWIAVCANVLAPSSARRWVARILLVASFFWFFFLYGPIAWDPERYLTIHLRQHSLWYDYFQIPIYQYASRPLLQGLYVAAVAAPLLLAGGENRSLRILGVLLAGSLLVSLVLFAHAFISVWCFFAAVVSGYLCVVFRANAFAKPQTAIGSARVA
jgi:hypothetical protein